MKNILRILICSLFLMVMSTMNVSAEEDINNNGNPEGVEDVEEPEEPAEPEEPEILSIEVLTNIKITFKNGNSYTYTGKKIAPTVKNISFVNENGEAKKLTEGFKITYTNNCEVGKADVTLTIEGYEGKKVLKDVFSIVMGKVSSVKTEPYSYNIIKLNWSTVKGAHGYTIYRSTKKGSYGSAIKRIESGNTKAYSDKTVKIGKTYYYRVRAYRVISGKRVYGEYSKQINQKARLAKAKINSVKRATYNSLIIEWDKVKDASGYWIYRSTSENGSYKRVAVISKNSILEYTNKIPTCGRKYYYKVVAYRKYNGVNYSGVYSDCVSGKTTPSKIAFTDNNISRIDSVSLCWKKSLGAEGYSIYRSKKSGSGYTCVKNITNENTLTWTDTLEDEKTYYYKIRPYTIVNNQKVYGSYSTVYARKNVRKLIEEVRTYTHVSYVSGGKTVCGWDCSGFTAWAMQYIYGVEIPTYSGAQADFGKPVNKYDMSKWQPGDILVYSSGGRINHVALYLGDSEMMHALNTKYDTVIQEVEYYESWDKKNNLCRVRRCF